MVGLSTGHNNFVIVSWTDHFPETWQTENYSLPYCRKGLNIDWKFVTKVTGRVEISVTKVTGRVAILTGTSRLVKTYPKG